MRIEHHPLVSQTVGTTRQLTSLHFGPDDAPRKAYIQAALHADEPPGLLVAVKLRARLAQLEAEGRLRARIVLVPVANPIGLAQWIDHSHIGRFELASADNFNRHYPDLVEDAAARLAGHLGADPDDNARRVRAALRAAVAGTTAVTELQSLRKTLLGLAVDSDICLDLHCDSEAALHLYASTPQWPQVEPLARLLGSVASLLETESGDFPFDEACSRSWWMLQARFPEHPLTAGCVCVTVELRGTLDVDHAVAERDTEAILGYFAHQGLIDLPVPTLPALLAPATPLAGSEPLNAPTSGVVVFNRRVGERVEPGDAIFDVIDPLTATTTTVKAGTAGILYARENRRFAHAGMRLAKIAGATAFRSGKLLSE